MFHKCITILISMKIFAAARSHLFFLPVFRPNIKLTSVMPGLWNVRQTGVGLKGMKSFWGIKYSGIRK